MKPRKNDKDEAKVNNIKSYKLKGNKKDKLLARWTDGLFYFVKVTKVSAANKKCMVEFEDHSSANVHFKDLLEEKEDGVTQCHCCGKGEARPTDQLVTCSNCDRDYHQSCHVPPIKVEELAEKFVCRICVFASCAQVGGAKSSGPLAEKFAVMKQHFPYNIKYLTWNAGHTSNVEHYFCYCGGPGIWYNKMLQCCRCRQWFHEACIQSLNEELLIGDRFYIFACAHCNHGVEFLQRMELDWLSIGHITVFHLIMTMGSRYVDLDIDILPFIMDHSQSFGFKKLVNGMHGSKDVIRDSLTNVFLKNSSIFCCGSEVKKRCTYYGVRERNPPNVPPISVPVAEYEITFESLHDPSVKKTTFHPSKYTFSVPYVLRGAQKTVPPTLSARLKESKMARIARVKSEHNYCTPVKSQEDSPIKQSRKSSTSSHLMADIFDANNNSPAKPSPEKFEDSTLVKKEVFEENCGEAKSCQNTCSRTLFYPDEEPEKTTFWSLDTAIPEPDNYTGVNHPFLTDFEQEAIRKKRKHFEEELQRLSTVLFPDESCSKVSKNPLHLVSPNSDMKVKGFKGELAELIQSSSKRQKISSSKAGEDQCYTENISNKPLSKPNRASSLSPHCVNSHKSLRNGFTHIKQESPTARCSDLLNKVADRKLKALSRCLKNLSPTCGFRFPVLEEAHSGLASNTSLLVNSLADLSEAVNTSVGSSSKSNKSSRVKEAKVHVRKLPSDFQETQSGGLTQDEADTDNVRRSHRRRHTVRRLEASIGNKSYDDYYPNFHCGTNEPVTAEEYEVISLRIRPDEQVEYLVNWSQT